MHEPNIIADSERPTWRIWCLFATLFVGFFVFEHDPKTSLYNDFVPEAEIREQWSEGGSRSRQLAILGLGAVGVLCFLLPSQHSIRITDPLAILFIIYLAFIAASFTWSIDPDATKRRLIVLAFFVLALLGIARQIPAKFVPEMTMVCMLGYLLIGLGCELALGKFQPWSGEHRFAGTTHPNIQAGFLVTLCLAAWAVHKQPGPLRPIALFIMITGLVFLYLTRSRTSAAGFFVAFLFANSVASDRVKSFKFGFSVAWLACLSLILILALGSNVTDSASDILRMGRREAAVEEASSLTGRLPLWVELSDYVKLKPICGHGYEAFWTTDNFLAVSSEIEWAPATAHSSFIECLLDLGYVGLAIMIVGMLVILSRLIWNCSQFKEPVHAFVLALFAYSLIHSTTEAGIRSPSTTTFFLALGIVTSLNYAESRSKSKATPSNQGLASNARVSISPSHQIGGRH
jgi:exopolysaccharide production protein ExoQ